MTTDAFTYTFRAFSRRFYPKRLTISTFVTTEKPLSAIIIS